MEADVEPSRFVTDLVSDFGIGSTFNLPAASRQTCGIG